MQLALPDFMQEIEGLEKGLAVLSELTSWVATLASSDSNIHPTVSTNSQPDATASTTLQADAAASSKQQSDATFSTRSQANAEGGIAPAALVAELRALLKASCQCAAGVLHKRPLQLLLWLLEAEHQVSPT